MNVGFITPIAGHCREQWDASVRRCYKGPLMRFGLWGSDLGDGLGKKAYSGLSAIRKWGQFSECLKSAL